MKRLLLIVGFLCMSISGAEAGRDCVGTVFLEPGCNVAEPLCQVVSVGGVSVSVNGRREVGFQGVEDLDEKEPFLALYVQDFNGVVHEVTTFLAGESEFISAEGNGIRLHVITINFDMGGAPPSLVGTDHHFSTEDLAPEVLDIPNQLVPIAASAAELVFLPSLDVSLAPMALAVEAQYAYPACN